MGNGATGVGDRPDGFEQAAESAEEKARHAAKTVKEKAAAAGQKAARKIDESREPAASAMESAATSLHENAERLPGGAKAERLVHRAAGKIEDAASYVRGHDARAAGQDIQEFVKSHPVQSLLAAVAVGFIAGRIFRH